MAKIGKYEIEKELGHGGFGRVYLGLDADMHRKVAIKVLIDLDPEKLKYFDQEVATTVKLRHPNIITIYDRGRDETGKPYLVMEFLEGLTLKDVIVNAQPLTLMQKVKILWEIAEGLAYAHGQGVVHRDIKPENIMLLADFTVKIMDFGIALAPDRTEMTQTGYMVGSRFYMSPEQFTRMDVKANEQTDIFAFGNVCYELLTGRHPFQQLAKDYGVDVITAIAYYDPPALGSAMTGCPDSLESAVHRALAKDPAFRYKKFSELALYLQEVLADLQHEQAQAILEGVTGQLRAGNLQEARARVLQAQQLDPGNREARRYRDQIDQQLAKFEVQSRVGELLTEAGRRMEERRFPEAVQALESAAKLDVTNETVRSRLTEAKARLDRMVRVSRLVEEGRSREEQGQLAEALERLKAAVEIDPVHTEASRLFRRVTEKIAERSREVRREQSIRTASGHLAAKRYAEAQAALDELEREQPGAPGITEIRARIDIEKTEEERRRRAERFNLGIARTREAMQAGELDRAGQMIEHLYTNFMDEPGAAEILPILRERWNTLKRAQEIAAVRQEAQDLIRRKSLREAVDLLGKALQRFPEDTGLERLAKSAAEMYEAQQRAGAVAQVLSEANRLRDGGRLAPALETLVDARRRLGDDPAVVTLARQLEVELEEQRYAAGREELLRTGRELVTAGRYWEAIDRIVVAGEYAGDAEVRALLESARVAASIEEEKRYTSEALQSALVLENAGDYERAMGAVQDALARYPHNHRLSQALDHLRDEIEQLRRREDVARRRAAIQDEIAARQWKRAEALLRKVRLEFPGETAFDDLSQQIEAGLHDAHLSEVEERVRDSLAVNNLAAAEEQIEHTRTVFAHDERWRLLEQEIARRRAYEDALAGAEQHRREGNLDRAEELLTGFIQSAPDVRATQVFQNIQVERARRAEEAKRRKIAAVADYVRGLLRTSTPDDAASALASARADFPGEAIWLALDREIDARRAELERQAEAARRAEEARKTEEARLAEVARQAEEQRQRDEARRAEEARKAEEARLAEVARQAQEERQRDETRRLEEARKAEEARLTEIARQADELRKRDEARRAEEARKAEEARLAEIARQADEQRKREEARQLDEARRAHESRLAEAARQAEEQRKREEARELEEARKAHEARLAEAARQAEEQRKREEARRLEEARRSEEARKAEAERQAEAARQRDEAQRLEEAHQAEEARRREEAQRLAPLPATVPASPPEAAVPQPAPRPIPWRTVGGVAVGAALVIGGIVSIPKLFRKPVPEPPAFVTVTIHTDPGGATVSLGDQRCVSPACQFSLKPGQYPLQAQHDGFEPERRAVTIEPGKPAAVEVSLKPLPPPPPPPGAKTGTIHVLVGLPQARVMVDGKFAGYTNSQGDLTKSLEAVQHDVRVEKDHYQAVRTKRITVAENSEQPVTFTLLPKNARLELNGAPSGIDIRIDDQVAARTDGSAAFPVQVTPGKHTLVISTWRQTRSFEPEENVSLNWKEIGPASITPKGPTEAETEERDWNQISSTSDPDKVKLFLSRHPKGVHAGQALEHLETLAWKDVDHHSVKSLEDFQRAFPNGPHAPQAESEIARLRAPIPSGGVKGPAVVLPNPDTNRNNVDAARQQILTGVRATIDKFNTLQPHHKTSELKKVWSNSGGALVENHHLTAKLSDPVEVRISPDLAVFRCTVETDSTQPKGHDKYTSVVTFERRGAEWIIQSMAEPK